MSEEKKCVNNNCQDCQNWLKENLAKCEDWEVKRKESYKKFELRFCQTNNDKGDRVIYSETGGYNYNWEKCPDCNKVIKTIKSNGQWGDSTVESEDANHALAKFKSTSQLSDSSSDLGNKNYLPWVLGGIGSVALIGIMVYFAIKNNKKGGEE